MKITYTWKIYNLQREKLDGYVFLVDWIFSGKLTGVGIGTLDSYSASISGKSNFSRPNILIPFEDLQEEVVLSWVIQSLTETINSPESLDLVVPENTIERMKKNIEKRIYDFYEPSTISGLSWT